MKEFPIFLSLQDRPALVVGGTAMAAAKARLLREAGARVTVIAEHAAPAMTALAATDPGLRLVERAFRAADGTGYALIYSATGNALEDARVSAAARAANVPVNAVDRPDLSTFITPAIVDRAPLTIAISSGGAAPVLTRRLRVWLESNLPQRIGRLAAFAGSFRAAVKAAVTDFPSRRLMWDGVFDGPIGEAVLAGDETGARERMIALINRPQEPHRGIVHIVGAGPGDPELLTLKALQALQRADIVVHDRLVSAEVLAFARRDAERVFVGKTPGNATLPQDDINALLARLAQAGKRVVRLKGGDPFIFGRGGEEVEYLRARGLDVVVVPGITAAAGCAAAALIPLTHRDHATAVTFVTGHASDGEPDLDWRALASFGQTLAVYMGIGQAPVIAERLIQAGRDPATPVAVIENGTTAKQRVVSGTLRGLARLVDGNAIQSPALLIIGAVTLSAADADRPPEALQAAV
ncbi:MAG: uroporphyrinogen-III C-methyltransferase [Alphaproteobacteria bacterium]|nr:uroporphyrinogen-III C-methyltransferase [Alphaproteobacteria bacterium]